MIVRGTRRWKGRGDGREEEMEGKRTKCLKRSRVRSYISYGIARPPLCSSFATTEDSLGTITCYFDTECLDHWHVIMSYVQGLC